MLARWKNGKVGECVRPLLVSLDGGDGRPVDVGDLFAVGPDQCEGHALDAGLAVVLQAVLVLVEPNEVADRDLRSRTRRGVPGVGVLDGGLRGNRNGSDLRVVSVRLIRSHRVERSLAFERRLPREDPCPQIDPALRIRLVGRSVDDALDVLQRRTVGRCVGDCHVCQIFDADVGHCEFDRCALIGCKGKAGGGIAVAGGKVARLEVWIAGDVRLAGAVPLDALPVTVVLLNVDGGNGDAGSLAAASLELEVLGQPEGLLAGVIGDVGRV